MDFKLSNYKNDDSDVHHNHNRQSATNANAKTASNFEIKITIDDNGFKALDSSSLQTTGSNMEH